MYPNSPLSRPNKSINHILLHLYCRFHCKDIRVCIQLADPASYRIAFPDALPGERVFVCLSVCLCVCLCVLSSAVLYSVYYEFCH